MRKVRVWSKGRWDVFVVATRVKPNRHVEGCPFCLRNSLIPEEKIVKKSRWATLVVEYSQGVPGTLQIVPVWHEMNITRWLRFLWSFFWLLWRLIGQFPFNLTVNFGKDAGQTLLHHLHFWVIPRVGELYSGKGLAYHVALEARCRRELGITLEQLLTERLNAKD